MHNYEVMVILDPQLDDRTVTATIDKFLLAITSNGGTVDKVDIWGRRRMTYQIQKHSEGIYVVVNVTSSPAAVSEFDRLLRLSESVLRTKVLRLEDAIFSINPIEFVPEDKPARAPRGGRPGGKRPSGPRSN
jgi:small subunit ribosomal protein S6